MAQNKKNLTIYLDEELLKKIKKEADINNRAITNQIEQILKEYFK